MKVLEYILNFIFMKTFSKTGFVLASLCTATLALGQQYNSYDDRYSDRSDRNQRRNERQSDRDRERALDERREYNRRDDENPRYNNRYEDRSDNGRQYTERDLSKAYDEGFEDGQRNQEVTERKERHENYKHFTFGIYGGANSTRFAGETVDSKNLTGRLGYQLGFFVRAGGRIYGQIGAE